MAHAARLAIKQELFFPQRLPQPPPAPHSQLPTASPHVGPRQTKATLQLPTAAPAVSKWSTTNQLQIGRRHWGCSATNWQPGGRERHVTK